MKKVIWIFLSVFLLNACSEEEQIDGNNASNALMVFGLVQKNQSNNGEKVLVPAKIVVTLNDVEGNVIYDKKVLDLFDFNGHYLTQNVTLKVGRYSVEEFFVMDADNKIIYASPKEESELAQYVNNPLPLFFDVSLDQVTQVLPEVLLVNETHTSNDFGYATFGFNVVDYEKEKFSVVAFDENNQITNFNLKIESEGNELFNAFLEEKTHWIVIDSEYDSFKLTFFKGGYESQVFNYTKEELTSLIDENNLKIYFKRKDDLILYFPFNGNVKDLSINQNHITSNVLLVEDRNGKENRALKIDKPIELHSNSQYEIEKNLSFAFWINFNQLNSAVLGIGVVNNIQTGYWFSIGKEDGTNGKLAFNYGNGGVPSPSSRKTFVFNENLQMNQWYHVVVTIDKYQNIKGYLNGQMVEGDYKGTAQEIVFNNNVTSGYLGKVWQSNVVMDGLIDEFRIYKKVLNIQEINELINVE